MLADSSEIRFTWGYTDRAHSFAHDWHRISPVRAFDLRDSIRRDLELRGARWIGDSTWPYDTASRLHRREVKWCLDSAVVYVIHSWQAKQPWEFVNFLVSAVPDQAGSPTAWVDERATR